MKGQFVTLQNAGQWSGMTGCVLGKGRGPNQWQVAVPPDIC